MAGMDCCRGARLAGAASLADQTWAVLLQLAFERVAVPIAARSRSAAPPLIQRPSHAPGPDFRASCCLFGCEHRDAARGVIDPITDDGLSPTGRAVCAQGRGSGETGAHPVELMWPMPGN